jgi:putative transposase
VFTGSESGQPDSCLLNNFTPRDTSQQVADQLRSKIPQLTTMLDASEVDVLVNTTFPKEYRAKIQSTNPIERLNDVINRRTDMVGKVPTEATITRLIDGTLLQANAELAV